MIMKIIIIIIIIMIIIIIIIIIIIYVIIMLYVIHEKHYVSSLDSGSVSAKCVLSTRLH